MSAAGANSTATGTVTLSGIGNAAGPGNNAFGSVTLSGASSTTGNGSATGALSLSGSAAWIAITAGSLSLSGTGVWIDSATGSVVLTGTGVWSKPATGSTSLAGSSSWTTGATGSIGLTGAATYTTHISGGGSITLTAISSASSNASATGSITLNGAAIAISGHVDLSFKAVTNPGRFTAVTNPARFTALCNPSRFTATLEIDVPTIYATAGNRVYVGVVLTEQQNIDITSDTIVMGLAAVPATGGTPEPPTQNYAPDVDTSLSASQRLVKLLVGADGTLDPSPGTYYAWVQDTSTPEIEWVPATSEIVTVI